MRSSPTARTDSELARIVFDTSALYQNRTVLAQLVYPLGDAGVGHNSNAPPAFGRPMIQLLTAIHMHRMLTSGRNRPVIFGCIDAESNSAGDYVVKLSGAMDTRARGPASELIASSLAGHFGILRPQPAAVQLHPDLMKWLVSQRPDLAQVLRTSTGLNFGTRLLTDVSIWPLGRTLPEAMLIPATQVFAFDALIANDDRRRNNPNVLVRGDEIFVIDHEAAFSFLYVVGQRGTAWDLRRRPFRDHVFYYQLRRQLIDVSLFMQRLAKLGDSLLESIARQVPDDWRHEDLGRISDHLRNLRDHTSEFERQVLECLA
jgi:hypothetical protein